MRLQEEVQPKQTNKQYIYKNLTTTTRNKIKQNREGFWTESEFSLPLPIFRCLLTAIIFRCIIFFYASTHIPFFVLLAVNVKL